MIAGGFCFLAVSFLTLSYQAADSEVFRLMGHQVSGYNSKYENKHAYLVNNHLEKQAQYFFIIVAFVCIFVAAFGVAASYSHDHLISYMFGYMSSIFAMIFIAAISAYLILYTRVADDLGKECLTKTGMAHQIDSIYSQGQKILCTEDCPCYAPKSLNLTNVTTASNGATRYLQCKNEQLSKMHEYRYAPLLTTMEKTFNCAGIC